MNFKNESEAQLNDRHSEQRKISLDIHLILKQMGIHPDKWLQFEEQAKK